MAAITSNNVANAIVKLVAADALPVLVGNLVMGNLVNRDYEPVLAQAGDTVNVPIPPTMVAHNIVEGGTVQTQNPDIGNAQIVLNTHVEATFQIPDVTKVLAVPDLLKIYMEPAVAAIAQRIEGDVAADGRGPEQGTPAADAGRRYPEAVRRAMRYRDGLMIALLAYHPLRLANFLGLRLGLRLLLDRRGLGRRGRLVGHDV